MRGDPVFEDDRATCGVVSGDDAPCPSPGGGGATDRQVAGEPLLHECVEQRLGFGKREVITPKDRQFRHTLRPTKDLQRLGGWRDAVVRAVVDEQGPRCDSTDHVVRAEVVDALCGVDREIHDPVGRKQRTEVFGDRDDVPALDHQGLTGLLAKRSAAFEDVEEPFPLPRAWVLALQLAGSVAPTADGDDRGDALVDATGVQRDGAAEALAADRDRVRVDVRLGRGPGER